VCDRVERLPGPQRAALRAAFGLEVSGAPDRFLASIALLTLLCEAAADRPLLCVVDDTQWLDRPTVDALAFAARRLEADAVAVVLAAREVSAFELPALEVTVLAEDAARGARAQPRPFLRTASCRAAAEDASGPTLALAHGRGQTRAEADRAC